MKNSDYKLLVKIIQMKEHSLMKAMSNLLTEYYTKEKVIVKKKTISEDMKMVISNRLNILKKNDMVKVVYYNSGEYLKIQGLVSKIDPTFQELTVVKTKISFSDIYELRIVEKNN